MWERNRVQAPSPVMGETKASGVQKRVRRPEEFRLVQKSAREGQRSLKTTREGQWSSKACAKAREVQTGSDKCTRRPEEFRLVQWSSKAGTKVRGVQKRARRPEEFKDRKRRSVEFKDRTRRPVEFKGGDEGQRSSKTACEG